MTTNYLPRELVSFDPLFDSNESSRELPWTVDDKSSIVEPRLPVEPPILEDDVTTVRLKRKHHLHYWFYSNLFIEYLKQP